MFRRREFWGALGAASLVVAAIITSNIITLQHDATRYLRPPPWWSAWLTELSSGVGIIAMFPIAYLGAGLPRPTTRSGLVWLRFFASHLAASIAYSLGHVFIFTVIRQAAQFIMGRRMYLDGLDQLFYEYRKDALSYVLIVAVISLYRQVQNRPTGAPTPSSAIFEIRDGTRLIRVPMADIAACMSAGNYVEFHLADGGKPLMRTTLATVEKALAEAGHVRTHRSWLVNPHRVRSIEPTGAGDWKVTLDNGVSAPLSRRYATALETLRRR